MQMQVTEVMDREKMVETFWDESKKMWHIAAPAMLTQTALMSMGIVTIAFVGHLGEVELAAVTLVQIVIEGFVVGVMVGMASALETLSGQSVGSGHFSMLGIYLQRSWIITGITSLILVPVYVFTSPFLQLLRQDKNISDLAGKYAMWVMPQLFVTALNFPIQKFLQSQSKVWVMAIVCIVGLAFHVLLNWVLVTILGRGLLGAAIAGNISWWCVALAQLVYVISGFFPDAWTGFSFSAFESLAAFAKLSLASAIMQCLEVWYLTAVILMAGGLKNPAVAVDAVSICMNLQLWTLMIALGFNVAISVRLSNELGAGNPKAAKFSILVSGLTSAMVGVLLTVAVLATKNDFPKIFTGKTSVLEETSKLGYLLAATIFLNGIHPVLNGVAIGAGWQFSVSLINISCYYIFGLPFAALLGYKFKLGVEGIWSGTLIGSLLQILILVIIILRTNWQKEALEAKQRVKTWGGSPEPQQNPTGPNVSD